MLVDANLLIYAAVAGSPQHVRTDAWLTEVLNGNRRIAIPWQVVGAFLRVTTNARLYPSPMTSAEALSRVGAWLDARVTWIPPTTRRTAAILADLMRRHQITAGLVSDAMIAAIAVEHGLTVMTADTDFARFTEVRWENPLLDRGPSNNGSR